MRPVTGDEADETGRGETGAGDTVVISTTKIRHPKPPCGRGGRLVVPPQFAGCAHPESLDLLEPPNGGEPARLLGVTVELAVPATGCPFDRALGRVFAIGVAAAFSPVAARWVRMPMATRLRQRVGVTITTWKANVTCVGDLPPRMAMQSSRPCPSRYPCQCQSLVPDQ